MSTPNDAPEDFVGNNDNWSGVEIDYAAGMSWNSSMFPAAPRDFRIYGPQDPLDFVPPPGPFDDEDGDQAWRKNSHGTEVYTGEGFIKIPRLPTEEDSARRKQFWATYDAHQGHPAQVGIQIQGQVEGVHQSFHDKPPTHSLSAPLLMAHHNISFPMYVMPPLPGLHNSALAATSARTPVPTPTAPAPTIHHSSVDGEYKTRNSNLTTARPLPTSANTSDRERVMSSTPPKTSFPLEVDDWDDANLLSLWKQKVIRKKGYEPMLATFTDQTVESLHKAWTTHKKRCRLLGAAWEAAEKPSGPLSEWFEE